MTWALLTFACFCMGCGLWLARMTAKRLDAMEALLAQVQGNDGHQRRGRPCAVLELRQPDPEDRHPAHAP